MRMLSKFISAIISNTISKLHSLALRRICLCAFQSLHTLTFTDLSCCHAPLSRRCNRRLHYITLTHMLAHPTAHKINNS